MSIFGVSVPKFVGTGTPDSNTITLTYGKILSSTNLSETEEIVHKSIINGNRSYDTLGTHATIDVLVQLHRHSVATARTTLTTLLTYKNQDVVLYLHKDGDTVGDGTGKALQTSTPANVSCRIRDIKPFYQHDNILFDACIITFITNEYYDISQTIQ